MERNEYLKYRLEEDQVAILVGYFSEKIGYEVSNENFIYIMWMAIEDDSNLQERIDNYYPLILRYYDTKFEVNFLIKEYSPEDRKLILMY